MQPFSYILLRFFESFFNHTINKIFSKQKFIKLNINKSNLNRKILTIVKITLKILNFPFQNSDISNIEKEVSKNWTKQD